MPKRKRRSTAKPRRSRTTMRRGRRKTTPRKIISKSYDKHGVIHTVKRTGVKQRSFAIEAINRMLVRHAPFRYCKDERERVRRAYFSFKKAMPHVGRKGGKHNDRFTMRKCK
jgi:hypothetical protein